MHADINIHTLVFLRACINVILLTRMSYLETIPEHEASRLRMVLRLLSGGAALVHAALCVYCIIKAAQTDRASPHVLSFYRARVSGERVRASATSYVDALESAAGLACPLNVSRVRLFVQETPSAAALGLEQVRQTWVADRLDGGINGFVVLAVVFAVSAVVQAIFAWRTLEEAALETFRQPSLLRWVEYALTAPLQVGLVACCVMVRDAQTVALLVAAQGALVLIGYNLEYAAASAELEELQQALPDFSLNFSAGKIVTGPPLDKRFMASQEQRASTSWMVGFWAATLLHVVIWFILIDQLNSVEREAACHVGSDEWRGPLRAVVIGQCVVFSLFAAVPLTERLACLLGDGDAGVRLVYCSIAYAVLSVAAKSMLAGSYVAFMELFPFVAR